MISSTLRRGGHKKLPSVRDFRYLKVNSERKELK